MDAQALNALLQLLPSLSASVAGLIRQLLDQAGFDLDRLLSTGQQTNSQLLTHLDMEIARVQNFMKPEGGDPQTIAGLAEVSAAKKPTSKK